MKITDEQRVLIREQINRLTVRHRRQIDRLTKDFGYEIARLEEMLLLGFVRQKMPRGPS